MSFQCLSDYLSYCKKSAYTVAFFQVENRIYVLDGIGDNFSADSLIFGADKLEYIGCAGLTALYQIDASPRPDLLIDYIRESFAEDSSDQNIAALYALCWNNLRYECSRIIGYPNERQNIRELREIELSLNEKIHCIMEEEAIAYPSSGDKTDYYLSLKPFMVKNGFTTGMTTKDWMPLECIGDNVNKGKILLS